MVSQYYYKKTHNESITSTIRIFIIFSCKVKKFQSKTTTTNTQKKSERTRADIPVSSFNRKLNEIIKQNKIINRSKETRERERESDREREKRRKQNCLIPFFFPDDLSFISTFLIGLLYFFFFLAQQYSILLFMSQQVTSV